MSFRQRLGRSLLMFRIFLKIGAFTFGGGFAMISLIEHETTGKRKLIDPQEILDIAAIAESTPGPIAINAATFVGYRYAGLPGALAATLGVVLPSFLIILGVAFFLRGLMNYPLVSYAFLGIRAGVLGLVVKAVVSFWEKADHSPFSLCLMAGAFLWAAVLKWNVVALIALCGAVGWCWQTLRRRRKKP